MRGHVRRSGRRTWTWLLVGSFGLGFASADRLGPEPRPGWPSPFSLPAAPLTEPGEPGSRHEPSAILVPAPRPLAAPRPGTAEIVVERGQTLLDLLLGQGLAAAEAHAAIESLREVFDPRRLRAGQTLSLAIDEPAGDERRLIGLALDLDPATTVQLARAETGFAARSIERPVQRDTIRVAAEIADSLYGTARRAALPPEAVAELVRLLSWDVDLQRELHPGDRLEVLLERVVNDAGQTVRSDGLVYVALHLRDRQVEAYRYTGRDGRTDYYDANGRALRRSLLRTPIDGARLSSTFGPRRHPVLGFTRMHKGIDFAAPPGTPIYAAGDGEIEFMGRNRGYGHYVRIRHPGGYSTAYAHLSRYAKELKRGHKVGQGQVIGYVGSTGLSTGPHLHYEVLKEGVQVDPLSLKQDFAQQLSGPDLRRFRQLRAQIDSLRDHLGDGTLVAQEGH